MQHFEFVVEPASQKKRLDVFIAEVQKELSRSRIKKLIEQENVSVNGSPVRAHYTVKSGDRIELTIPPPSPLDIPREQIPLNIIYQDDSMLVVDKPAGMVIHPAPGHSTGTLVNALLHQCADLSGIGGVERPGIVHRLDKNTSGLVLVAKTEPAHKSLARQFKDRKIKKVYLALVRGKVRSQKGTIDAPIGRHKIHRKKMSTQAATGRDAQTLYEVIEKYDFFSYLRLFPRTGRTHQIRVHLSSIGHPILGDDLYGGKLDPKYPKMSRQALHAHRLELHHPLTGKKLVFDAPLPQDMADYLKNHLPL